MDKSLSLKLLKSPEGLEFLGNRQFEAFLDFIALEVEASFDSVTTVSELRQLQGKEKLIARIRALPVQVRSQVEQETKPKPKEEPAFAGDRR